MVFNATFNNISVISWRSVLLVEETGVPGDINFYFSLVLYWISDQTHGQYTSICIVKEPYEVIDILCLQLSWKCLFWSLMVFNATFNNISVISWRSVLLVEETGVHGENQRPATSH
jgi:hypothetical protein